MLMEIFMKKENFLTQVTTLFTASKLDELKIFLNNNLVETVKNKKLISTLNSEMGDESIKETLNKISKAKRAKNIALTEAVNDAIVKNDEKLLIKCLSLRK